MEHRHISTSPDNDSHHAMVRIGIDVGGTFTHAVAIDFETLDLIGKTKVPTTHRAPEGVAKGIIESLKKLLDEAKIDPSRVRFIAHSTTQATNALLEGDVAMVGVLGMGGGANAWLASSATNVGRIELAKGKFLYTVHTFIDTSRTPTDDQIEKSLDHLLEQGVQAIAVSEAFSVDAPGNEDRVLAIARGKGLLATSGSEVSQLYGLRVRTRTAVINASMLPKMLESANMTEKSVRDAGINSPVMIMRSDGGVMDIDAMRRKPIMTMLSGPAAGVAAAMMFLHVSDGIFLEIGGTSTDISAISNGRAKIRSGEIGGHKVYMHTLDVRTVGVAGGSIPRVKHKVLIEVGPRSAHIAGLQYVSFSPPITDPKVKYVSPCDKDPDDYAAISSGDLDAEYCLTPTCAANFLGLIPEGDCARADKSVIQGALEALSRDLGKSLEETANEILTSAAGKCEPIVRALIKDYKLDPGIVSLIGGGGGAAAIVPFLSKKMGMRHQLSNHTDVISAIGVAMALIRETVERQIFNPTNDDILRLRDEARTSVLKMGADPQTIDIVVEIDSRANVVRAIACGATSMTGTKLNRQELSDGQKLALAADSMRVDQKDVKMIAETNHFRVFSAQREKTKLFGLITTSVQPLRILDAVGNIRLQVRNGVAQLTPVKNASLTIQDVVESHSQWGDAGKVIPGILLLAGAKIVDLSGLLDSGQVVSLAAPELESLPQDADIIVVANLN